MEDGSCDLAINHMSLSAEDLSGCFSQESVTLRAHDMRDMKSPTALACCEKEGRVVIVHWVVLYLVSAVEIVEWCGALFVRCSRLAVVLVCSCSFGSPF